MFIRLEMNKFILIKVNSLKHEARNDESQYLINWFKSSPDLKKYELKISTYYPPDLLNQNDTYSCGPFVCIHAFNASVLSSNVIPKLHGSYSFVI